MGKFNIIWGIAGFALGVAISGVALGVAFAFIYGYLLFPNNDED